MTGTSRRSGRPRRRRTTLVRTALLAALATLATLATLAAATPTAAQVPTLDRVDSLVTAGNYDDARATLDRWWSARDNFDVPGSDQARGLMLRAQLTPTPEQAEPDYLAVVLGYPTSPYAPEALLRLGQGLLATGDASRAAAYLERLAADYPGRPDRAVGLLWLARANAAARRPAAACSAAREGLRDTVDPDLAAMLRVEEDTSCGLASEDGPEPERDTPRETQPATEPDRAPATEPDRDPATEPDAEPVAMGEWSVQTGAFRYRRSADALIEELREAGYEPRLVLVPANDLLRVRLGRFTSAEEAARLVTRLRSGGFEAVVVRGADEERRP